MGQAAKPEMSREAEIDAALKSLFNALAGRPTPQSFMLLIEQLERDHRAKTTAQPNPSPSAAVRRPRRVS